MEEEKREFEVRDKRKVREDMADQEDVSKEENAEPKADVQTGKDEQEEEEAADDTSPFIPEATFVNLITSFSTNAMVHLGVLSDPTREAVERNLGVAKHMIDTIALLEEKTKGNLGKEEEIFLKDTLYNLRMIYVSIANQNTGE